MKLSMYLKLPCVLAAGILTASALTASAQGPNDQGGPGGQRPNFEEMRKRMMEQTKSTLKVSDDEWAVIQPLIEKIQTKQRESGGRFGGFGFGPPPGGAPPRDGNQPAPSATGGQQAGSQPGGNRPQGGGPFGSNESPERQALRTALEKDDTSASDLKAKLTAVREQRQKSAAELAQTREELRKLLTVRQEALLVAMGILE